MQAYNLTSTQPSDLLYPHHPTPNPTVNHSPHPKRRHDPAHPSQTAPEPIPPHFRHPRPPSRAVPHGSVVQIQPPQMQRRAQELYARRGQKLRDADPADRLFHLLRYRQPGRNERWEVEGRENRQGIPHREERVAGFRDRPRRRARDAARGAEHAGELAVFVEAEGHVDACRGEKLRGAGGGGPGGGVGDCAADCVDGVGCGVGAEVEG